MRLVVGSCVQLSKEILDDLGVGLVEYPLFVDGEPYPATLDMSGPELDRLRETMLDKNHRIETSGLREGDLLPAYRDLAGETIVSFHQAEEFSSSTYQALEKVSREHPEIDVVNVDGGHTCAGYSVQVLQLARALRAGVTRDELPELVARLRRDTVEVGATRDLFYLARTGRIGAGRALLGTALGLLPMLIVEGHEAIARPFGRVRTPAQANRKMLERLRGDLEAADTDRVELVIAWFGEQERWADALAELVEREGWRASIHRDRGRHSASVHLGPDYWHMGYTVDPPDVGRGRGSGDGEAGSTD